jgi:hypothetical protein
MIWIGMAIGFVLGAIAMFLYSFAYDGYRWW